MKTTLSVLSFLLLSSAALQAQDETLDATLKRLEKQIAELNTKVQTLTAAAEKAEENAVPVGAIVAFGGPESEIPDGWLPCHGQSLETSKYPKLSEALAKSWGGNSSGTKFNAPDLRGQFLRGWDENAENDPDKLSRTAKNGGNSGNKVGSYQEDATSLPNEKFTGTTSTNGEHKHNINGSALPEATHIDWAMDDSRTKGTKYDKYATNAAGDHKHNVVIEKGGDSETRPKNANVIFIIKAE